MCNETTIHQGSNEFDESNYSKPYGLQKWENSKGFSRLYKALTWTIWNNSIDKTNGLTYNKTIVSLTCGCICIKQTTNEICYDLKIGRRYKLQFNKLSSKNRQRNEKNEKWS